MLPRGALQPGLRTFWVDNRPPATVWFQLGLHTIRALSLGMLLPWSSSAFSVALHCLGPTLS